MYSYSVVPSLTAKMSILLWITTKMEYKIKYYNHSLLLPRVVINSTIKGLIINLEKKR